MFRNEKKITEDGGEGAEYATNHVATQDAVFGELTEEGPNYRAVRPSQRFSFPSHNVVLT